MTQAPIIFTVPRNEKQQLTFLEEGIEKYVVTKHILNGQFKLYKVVGGQLQFLKSKNTPLFSECN